MTLGDLVRKTVLTVAALAAGSAGAGELVQSRAVEPARASVADAAAKRLTQDLPAPRHGGGRVSSHMPSAEYVLPGVSPATEIAVVNLDSVERTLWLYAGVEAVDESRPTQVTLAPGATQTVTGLAGTTYVHTKGDPSLVQLEARTVAGETSMVVPAAGFLPTGAHARLPIAEEGQGLVLGTTRNPASFNVEYQYSSGTPIESFVVALDKYSTFTADDLFQHLTATPVVDGQLVVIPNNARTFIYGSRQDPESGDCSLWKAQTREEAPEEFILPEVRRETTTVPFAKYTSLDTINPDQTPFQVPFTISFKKVDEPGSNAFVNGTQLYALTHDHWDDLLTDFLIYSTSQGDATGSGFVSQPTGEEILTWSELYTMLPSGKVGAVIPPLPTDEPCSPDYECSVMGLGGDSTLGMYNLSPLPTTTQLDGFDAAGEFTGTTTVSLGQYENTRLADISDTLGGATRALIRVQDSYATGEHIDEIVAWATRDTATGDLDYHNALRIPTRENHAPEFVEICDVYWGDCYTDADGNNQVDQKPGIPFNGWDGNGEPVEFEIHTSDPDGDPVTVSLENAVQFDPNQVWLEQDATSGNYMLNVLRPTQGVSNNYLTVFIDVEDNRGLSAPVSTSFTMAINR